MNFFKKHILFLRHNIVLILLSILFFIVYSSGLILFTQKYLSIVTVKKHIQSNYELKNGYVYSYPDALLPFIAITPGNKNCSPEYALYKEINNYYDPATKTNNQYYTGTSVAPDAWEKDAHRISEVVGIDLTTNTLTGSVAIFASSCTPHYLFTAVNFMIHGENEDYIFVDPSPIVKLYSPNIAINTAQFPLNDLLFKPGEPLQTEPKFAMPSHCSCDGSGNPQMVTVSDQQFLADTMSIQTNKSKKYGLLYQTIYTLHGKVIGMASYLSDGSLLSFTRPQQL